MEDEFGAYVALDNCAKVRYAVLAADFARSEYVDMVSGDGEGSLLAEAPAGNFGDVFLEKNGLIWV